MIDTSAFQGKTAAYYTLGCKLNFSETSTFGQMLSALIPRANAGNQVFKASYDAWGNQTVEQNDIDLRFGYCGHEMLPEFRLIDMGGRMYDPVLGRFLSCDNFVQEPDNSQNFNRYSYCLNNPLRYTDPSGELFGIDDAVWIFAAFSAASSAMQAAATGQSVWKAVGISLLSSAASYGIGCWMGPTGNFWHEAARAGLHGLASGAAALCNKQNFLSAFVSGAASSGIGSFAETVNLPTGAVIGCTTVMGGLTSWATGGDIWRGAMNGLMIGALNHAQHEHRGPTMKQLKEINRVYRQSLEDYPTPQEFYRSVGLPEYENACAARMSYALNESGVLEIPYIEGITQTGTDGKNYFMYADEMGAWLGSKQVWGAPRVYTDSNKYKIKNGVVFQTGFEHVTGHIEYFYKGYDGHRNSTHLGALDFYKSNKTITRVWKYGR